MKFFPAAEAKRRFGEMLKAAAPMTTAMTDTSGQAGRAMRPVAIWLFLMCALIALMVVVGGATRLTDSGLSITEWRPITGAIPPLSDADWAAEFEKYRRIPEYEIVNRGMSLEEFQEIYWWEWGHRLLGRLIGAAFLLPLIFFAATGRVGRNLGLKLAGLFVLGGMQGGLGWYMVKSGLADRVDVSQYRLAAHLGLAVLLFALMFWLALSLERRAKKWNPVFRKTGATTEDSIASGDPDLSPDALVRPRNAAARTPLFWGGLALAAGVYAQMLLGAFVAGLRAGRTYNTWPLIGGKFFPDAYFSANPRFADLFEQVAAVQFNHRVGAYLVAAGAVWFALAARRTAAEGAARLVLAAVLFQIALGIWTLLAATPLALGLAHQAGALIVLGAALNAAHSARDRHR